MNTNVKKIIWREGLVFGIWLALSLFVSIRAGDRVEMHVHRFYLDLFFAYFKPCVYTFIIIRGGILAMQILKNRTTETSRER
jgi:hypothetical protein